MKKNGKSFMLKLAVCAFAVYIAVSLVYQTVQIRETNAKLTLIKTQVADQQKKNAQIKRELAENDEQFMESVARNDLGYAKPNERIYVDASGN